MSVHPDALFVATRIPGLPAAPSHVATSAGSEGTENLRKRSTRRSQSAPGKRSAPGRLQASGKKCTVGLEGSFCVSIHPS